jgi:hypothetical protein
MRPEQSRRARPCPPTRSSGPNVSMNRALYVLEPANELAIHTLLPPKCGRLRASTATTLRPIGLRSSRPLPLGPVHRRGFGLLSPPAPRGFERRTGPSAHNEEALHVQLSLPRPAPTPAVVLLRARVAKPSRRRPARGGLQPTKPRIARRELPGKRRRRRIACRGLSPPHACWQRQNCRRRAAPTIGPACPCCRSTAQRSVPGCMKLWRSSCTVIALPFHMPIGISSRTTLL